MEVAETNALETIEKHRSALEQAAAKHGLTGTLRYNLRLLTGMVGSPDIRIRLAGDNRLLVLTGQSDDPSALNVEIILDLEQL